MRLSLAILALSALCIAYTAPLSYDCEPSEGAEGLYTVFIRDGYSIKEHTDRNAGILKLTTRVYHICPRYVARLDCLSLAAVQADPAVRLIECNYEKSWKVNT